MRLLLVLTLTPLAGEPAYWSSDTIAAGSAQFAKAQGRDAGAYERAQDALEKGKRAVADLDMGVALVGSPEALVAYDTSQRRALAGQFLQLSKHADLLADDYSRIFGDAVQRALPTVGKGFDVKECTGGSAIEAMMHRSPKCAGKDLSPALIAAIDGDPKLTAAIKDILTVEWPVIALPTAPQAVIPLTGTVVSVDAAALARALRGDDVKAAQDSYEADIEQIDSDAETDAAKKAAIAQGEAIRARWTSAMNALGADVIAKAKKSLTKAEKKGGPAAVGVCPNPAALGGCGVPDVTAAVVAALSPNP